MNAGWRFEGCNVHFSLFLKLYGFLETCAGIQDLVAASGVGFAQFDVAWGYSTLNAVLFGTSPSGPASGWATPQSLTYETLYPPMPQTGSSAAPSLTSDVVSTVRVT